jgi:uncharacterized membrane protein YkoI
MTRTILFTASLASAAALFVLGANAQQQGAQTEPQVSQEQPQKRMSMSQIASMLEAQGYTVLEIELEHGRYDVEMTDANGMRVEAYLDPVTGAVLPYRDDDDYAGYRGHDREEDDRYGRDDD